MPRSIFLSAIIFIGFGIACLLLKGQLGFSIPAPLWISFAALAGGLGLLRGYRSARRAASLVIFVGYFLVIFDLLSYSLTPRQGTADIWVVYGHALLAVAILTLVSRLLWSRSVSIFLNRF